MNEQCIVKVTKYCYCAIIKVFTVACFKSIFQWKFVLGHLCKNSLWAITHPHSIDKLSITFTSAWMCFFSQSDIVNQLLKERLSN